MKLLKRIETVVNCCMQNFERNVSALFELQLTADRYISYTKMFYSFVYEEHDRRDVPPN